MAVMDEKLLFPCSFQISFDAAADHPCPGPGTPEHDVLSRTGSAPSQK